MKKLAVMLFVAALFVVPASAQSVPEDVGPGLVTASNPFYQVVDKVPEDVGLFLGVSDRDEVLQERAAEIRDAQGKNDVDAIRAAVEETEDAVRGANSNHSVGLERAEERLKELRSSQLPPQAYDGIDRAIDNVQKAKQRAPGKPDDVGKPDNTPDTDGLKDEAAQFLPFN